MILSFAFALALSTQAATPPSAPAQVRQAVVSETTPVPVPPPGETALRYYASGNVLWVVDQAFPIALLLVILFTGFSATLRNWSRRIGRNWFFTIVVYFVLFTIITSLVSLPLDYYRDFIRQHDYGLSNQTLQKWWADWLKSLVVGCIGGSLFLWVPYLMLKKSPRRWWLYTSIAAVPFIILVNLVAPIWISPLFNHFGPMQDKAMEVRILALADRAGIEGSRVFEVNKSVDTKTLNAYVAGVFHTKRIVVWDTTLARMNDHEILFVVAHEMGHYVLGHLWQLIAFSSLLIAATLYVAYRTMGGAVRKWSARFRFVDLADIASLPLLLLVTNIFSLAITPAVLGFTRHVEHEADRFGLEITEFNHSAGMAFVKLQEDALGNPWPGPVYKYWRESHPPLGERIEFSNAYHPWREGQPLQYDDKFRR